VFDLEETMKKLIPVLALASLLAACGKETEAKMKSAASEVKTKTAEGVEQAKAAISKAVAEFEKTSDESLSRIDTQIAELRAKSKNASESVRAEIDESLAGLEKERKAMGEKLTELKTAAPEKAKELLEKAKASLASLQKSAQDAIQRYQ
jgi:DNA anti-recombination protein RmuC